MFVVVDVRHSRTLEIELSGEMDLEQHAVDMLDKRDRAVVDADNSRDYPFCSLSRYAYVCNICGRADTKQNLKGCFNVFHQFMPHPESGDYFEHNGCVLLRLICIGVSTESIYIHPSCADIYGVCSERCKRLVFNYVNRTRRLSPASTAT